MNFVYMLKAGQSVCPSTIISRFHCPKKIEILSKNWQKVKNFKLQTQKRDFVTASFFIINLTKSVTLFAIIYGLPKGVVKKNN
jgi:hypothetical protein